MCRIFANLIKGLPPKLSLLKKDIKLRPDSVESHEARHENILPLHPYRFKALCAALTLMQPSLSVSNFNIVTGLNNFRQILRFYKKDENSLHNFRIDFELVKSTLFISRWDNYITGNAKALVSRGYGRRFERNCVTQQTGALQDASSYHRLTSFCIGGLSFLLQHEADAFFCPCHIQELNGTETTVP